MNKKIFFLILTFIVITMIATAVLLLTGPKMRTQPSLRTFEARVAMPPQDAIPFREFSTPDSSKAIPLPGNTSSNLDRGEVYYNYYCIFCHGEGGRGNGPVGESYVPKPADLSAALSSSVVTNKLHERTFSGTGHEPVLKRVVKNEHRGYILLYISETFRN